MTGVEGLHRDGGFLMVSIFISQSSVIQTTVVDELLTRICSGHYRICSFWVRNEGDLKSATLVTA